MIISCLAGVLAATFTALPSGSDLFFSAVQRCFCELVCLLTVVTCLLSTCRRSFARVRSLDLRVLGFVLSDCLFCSPYLSFSVRLEEPVSCRMRLNFRRGFDRTGWSE